MQYVGSVMGKSGKRSKKINNAILNKFFTKDNFSRLAREDYSIYAAVVERYIDSPGNKENGRIINEIYEFISKSYRNEYFYQNTLLNKLLLEKHNLSNAAALTQLPICKSKADFVLINGKAVVYEIKTELDTFNRLDTQLRDYLKAFSYVCVVTSETKYDRAVNMLKDTPVGIYTLTSRNTISKKKRKEPEEDTSKLNHTAIFKVLRKRERENILLKYFGGLPDSPQAFYFGECLKLFSEIPIKIAYMMALEQLNKRNQIKASQIEKIPYELKSLAYFSKLSKKDWQAIKKFMSQKYEENIND